MAPTYVVGTRDRCPTPQAAPHSSYLAPAARCAKAPMKTEAASRKAALRTASFALRAGVAVSDRRAFAEDLARAGPGLLGPALGRSVAGFWPIRGEPDCLPLLAALDAVGFRTLLPVTGAPGSPLLFRPWRPGDQVAPNALGIAEPCGCAEAVDPDILLIPCAAFDRRGHRIGFGRGYYDATLAALRAQRPTLALALAFACQEVDEVPAEAHDERLDAVITERDILICTGTGKALHAASLHR